MELRESALPSLIFLAFGHTALSWCFPLGACEALGGVFGMRRRTSSSLGAWGTDMTDLFRHSKRRIARAKTHIEALGAGLEAYYQSRPFKDVEELDRTGPVPMRVFKIVVTKPLDDELNDRAVEAIDALRSALDQACYASARSFGHQDPKSAYFPFADTEADLENTIKGRCKDLDPEIVDLLRKFRPYRWGAGLIWAFNKVRQGNQHKILAAVGTAAREVKLGNQFIPAGGRLNLLPEWDTETGELTVGHCPEGQPCRIDLNFKLSACFKDAGPLSGEEAMPALQNYGRMVEGMVMAIEAETARILRERKLAS